MTAARPRRTTPITAPAPEFARTSQGLTLAELGKRVGYSAAQVSRYERGIAPLTDIAVLRRFAAALAIPPQVFGLAPAGPAAAQCCAPSAGLNASLDAERIAAVAKALAEPVRVQILYVLRRSEQQVCQCELIPLFGITQPLLSHHLKKLIDAGVVQVERRHKWAYYSVSTDALKELTAWLG